MTTEYKKLATKDLIQTFARSAAERGLALRAANPDRANARYKTMTELYHELCSRGMEAQRELLSLLESQDGYVRLSAATYALEFDAPAAVPVLQKIDEEERNLLGFTAGMVLKQWREGKLHLP
jgi:HEAT repeat protein